MVTPDRDRYAYVYCRSAEQKAEWESKAKESNIPLSKFLVEIIEKALDSEKDSQPRSKLIKEVVKLKNEKDELQRDLKTKNIVIDRYEEELRIYRNAAFLDTEFKGKRELNKDLIRLLKLKKEVIDSYMIADEPNVDLRDSEAVKALSNELDTL